MAIWLICLPRLREGGTPARHCIENRAIPLDGALNRKSGGSAPQRIAIWRMRQRLEDGARQRFRVAHRRETPVAAVRKDFGSGRAGSSC